LSLCITKNLESKKIGIETRREKDIEDRKDKRARIVGTQQSAIANQKQKQLDAIDFEDPSSIESLQDPLDSILPEGM